MRNGLSALWHVGCSLLCTSCFYVQPSWKPPENRLPVLQSVQPLEGTVVFDNDIELIRVVASDEDEDFLVFNWDPPPRTTSVQHDEEIRPGVFSSRLELEYTESMVGETVFLTILDSEGAVDLAWLVEAP